MVPFDYWQLKVLDRCLKCFHFLVEVLALWQFVCIIIVIDGSLMGQYFEGPTKALLCQEARMTLEWIIVAFVDWHGTQACKMCQIERFNSRWTNANGLTSVARVE